MMDFGQVMQKNNEAVEKLISGSFFMAHDTFRECLTAINTQLHYPTTSQVSQDNDDNVDPATRSCNESLLLDQIRRNLSFHLHSLDEFSFDVDDNNKMDATTDAFVEAFIHTRPIIFTNVPITTTGSHLCTTTTITTRATGPTTNSLLTMIIGTLFLAVATFNLGLLHHVRGKSTSNPVWLRKAQQLYHAVIRLQKANPYLSRGLLLVATNNYSQLCLELREQTLAEQVASRVWLDHLTERQRLQEECLLLFRDEEWGGIMRNMFVLSFSAKYPSCAPAA